jgi:hypothetical protein
MTFLPLCEACHCNSWSSVSLFRARVTELSVDYSCCSTIDIRPRNLAISSIQSRPAVLLQYLAG